jgi:hypothetical protein
MSRYGKTKAKQNSITLGNSGGGYALNETAAITGTLLEAASAANRARPGDIGTTTVKRSVQTARPPRRPGVTVGDNRDCRDQERDKD